MEGKAFLNTDQVEEKFVVLEKGSFFGDHLILDAKSPFKINISDECEFLVGLGMRKSNLDMLFLTHQTDKLLM